jgi:hypothetical protein
MKKICGWHCETRRKFGEGLLVAFSNKLFKEEFFDIHLV